MHINQCMKYQCMKGCESVQEEESLMSLFREISNRLSLKMNKFYEPYGLTAVQFFILVELSLEDHQTISTLAKKLNMSTSNLSAILKRMEKHEFVKRCRDGKDQRIVHIEQTNKAKQISEEMKKESCGAIDSMLPITQEEKACIRKGLELLNTILKECDEE